VAARALSSWIVQYVTYRALSDADLWKCLVTLVMPLEPFLPSSHRALCSAVLRIRTLIWVDALQEGFSNASFELL
jgi:hypothetical protein